MSTLKHPMVA